jgi:ribonuclease Z
MNIKTKRKALIAVIIIFIVAWGTYAFFPTDLALNAFIKHRLSKTAFDKLERNEMEILFCGTGSPRHGKKRGQPCLGIIAGGQFIIIDAGQGSSDRLQEMGAPWAQISAIFLTHFHSDHMSGLGELINGSWRYRRKIHLHVYGPKGTKKLVKDFAAVNEPDIRDRTFYGSEKDLLKEFAYAKPHTFAIAKDDMSAHMVYEKNGLVVKAFLVEHPPWKESYGYRIEYKGNIVVVSGDTKYSKRVETQAQGADLLIHEAFSERLIEAAAIASDELGVHPDGKTIRHIIRTHTGSRDAAKIARDAGVKQLVLTHIIPPLPNWITERIFLSGLDEIYDGDIVLAEDGLRIYLPN